MARIAEPRGQASVALVASLPFLALAVLVAAQLVSVGHASWSAGNAARAAIRAELVGADPERAARGALPPALREGLELDPDAEPGALRLAIPGPAGLPEASVRIGGVAQGGDRRGPDQGRSRRR